jgi:hypothetical protein
MANKIGSLRFEWMEGELLEGTLSHTDYHHPGRDGRGVIFGARHTPYSTIRTISKATASTREAGRQMADVAWRAYKQYQKQTVAVIDRWGQQWDQVLVVDVLPGARAANGEMIWRWPTVLDAAWTWMVEVEWKLLVIAREA